MELLIGAVVAVLTEAYKWIIKKFGADVGHIVVYIGVFVLCLAWAAFKQYDLIKPETYITIGQIFASALAFYEVVIKWIGGKVMTVAGR